MIILTLGRWQQSDEGRLQALGAGALEQCLRRAGGEHLPRVHRHQMIEAGGLLHVGRRHDHAHAGAAAADAVDQLPELAARQRIHARGRLIQDQQVGVVDQRAAQAELLLHAAGELTGGAVEEGFQTRTARQFGDASAPFGMSLTKQAPEEFDVLRHRQRRIEILAQPLWHVGDARPDLTTMGGTTHVAVQHLKRAGL